MTTRYEVCAPAVVAETLDGEVMVIDFDTGAYYSLTGSAAAIWTLVSAHHDVDGIAARLEPQLPAARDIVAQFVAELCDHELIRPSEQPPQPVDLTPFVVGDAPTLETFNDMKEMLLLDPIHDVSTVQGWPFKRRTS